MQSAYRPLHSTETTLLKVQNDVGFCIYSTLTLLTKNIVHALLHLVLTIQMFLSMTPMLRTLYWIPFGLRVNYKVLMYT